MPKRSATPGSGRLSVIRRSSRSTSVGLELIIGLWLALALNRAFRGRGLVRAAVLIPWAIPTVVSALLWRFMFEGQTGIVNSLLVGLGASR